MLKAVIDEANEIKSMFMQGNSPAVTGLANSRSEPYHEMTLLEDIFISLLLE